MLKSVKIENFRGLQSLELQNLGRLNLLVGANNCGKTSILEAIQLLCSPDDIESFLVSMETRGESSYNYQIKDVEFAIQNLFYSYTINLNSSFLIYGKRFHDQDMKFSASIEKNEKRNQYHNHFLELKVSWKNDEWEEEDNNWQKSTYNLPLTLKTNCLSRTSIQTIINQHPIHIYEIQKQVDRSITQFITPFSLSAKEMVDLFEDIVLTPEESFVENALKTIEPKIERIASVSPEREDYRSREGFLVRLSDRDRPVPIGSLGDGIWRMLGLALAIVNTRDGFLFIDEIDTGLHYTAMADMWKLVWETAKRLNVQVFATTHSSDCWRSLATIASEEDAAEDGIRIHRIERDNPQSIVFSEKEIAIAATQDIEVR